MKDILRIYDRGNICRYRYTVLRIDWKDKDHPGHCLGISLSALGESAPWHDKPGRHLGKRIKWADLPPAARWEALPYAMKINLQLDVLSNSAGPTTQAIQLDTLV